MSNMTRLLKTFWNNNRTLIVGLTLPLLLASIFALWFSRPITVREVLLNLATDLITIIITVWYVDLVIHRQEQVRWHNAEKFISAEVGKLGHALISEIVESAKLSKQIFPSNDPPLHKRRVEDIQAEVLKNAKNLDHDQIIGNLKQLNADQWSNLMQHVQGKSAEITNLLSQFGSRLSPEKLEVLLTLREAIGASNASYELFRGFLGMPISMLPKVKDGKPLEFTALATIRIGIDLRIILQRSLAVIDAFEYVVTSRQYDY